MASFFSAIIYFTLALALVLNLACIGGALNLGGNSSCGLPVTDLLTGHLNLIDYFKNVATNPTNLILSGIAIGAALLTGNIYALSIPIVLMIMDFIIPIETLLNELFATGSLDPSIGVILAVIAAAFKIGLLISAIQVFRGLLDV